MAGGLTVTVADCVTGPPGPCAVIVNVWEPASSPPTAWLPLAEELATPVPATDTAVALALDQVTVTEPGAVALVGLTLIEADTDGGAPMETVCEIVPELTPLESTALAVKVMVAGPLSDVEFPESPSVPLPPPAKAKPTPFFQMFT